MLTETLTPEDIKTFLTRLTTAIELDQVYVDALPPESFSIEYDDSMWRTWRHDHRVYLEKLHATTDAIPPVMMWQLTGIAVAHEPALVGNTVLEVFAEVVSGSCGEDLGTAERFFDRLIQEVNGQPKGKRSHGNAQALILEWLPESDPLRIARDPECGYVAASTF